MIQLNLAQSPDHFCILTLFSTMIFEGVMGIFVNVTLNHLGGNCALLKIASFGLVFHASVLIYFF